MLSWKELKERRLVQIVVSYAVAGWVILSIFGEVIDRGVLPEILYRVLLVLYLGGFVAATVTGWFHGEKGHQKVTRPEVVLLTIVGLLTLAGSVQTVRGHMAEQAMRAAGLESGIPLNHLAVLYFQDRTRGEDLTYLADGLTETLIDRLSRTQTLTVLTQNASALYRDSDLPFDAIAADIHGVARLAAPLVSGLPIDFKPAVGDLYAPGQTGPSCRRAPRRVEAAGQEAVRP